MVSKSLESDVKIWVIYHVYSKTYDLLGPLGRVEYVLMW